MNKDNQFKSSLFHMDEGDVLHILIKDEQGVTSDVSLVNASDGVDVVPNAPTAQDASDITSSSFVANWLFNENTTGYYLDVHTNPLFPTDDPSDPPVLDNYDVGNVNKHTVTGLTDTVVYYYRVRAYNETGTSTNSNVITITTPSEELVDIDGNIYTTIIIGGQRWTVQNLKTTRYADGTVIPTGLSYAQWAAQDGSPGHDGTYTFPMEDVANKNVYGLLYNWFTTTNSKKLISFTKSGVPDSGWRVPTLTDLDTLVAYLGGLSVAGGVLKEVGTTHWLPPNIGATNTSGFTAVAPGLREDNVDACSLGDFNYLWSSTESYDQAWLIQLSYASATVYRSAAYKIYGLTIRCVKDI
jgi:uncharacterized protein (TIGR02145 family)